MKDTANPQGRDIILYKRGPGLVHTRRRFLASALVPAFAYILWPQRCDAVEVTRLVLVTAQKTSLASISSGSLRHLFLGESVRDDANQKLVPLNQQAGTPERTFFDARILGMSADDMAGYWVDQKVRGLKGPPRSLAPAQLVARVVEKFPGAISYLLPEHVIPGLRIVPIDNIQPGLDGYALTMKGRK